MIYTCPECNLEIEDDLESRMRHGTQHTMDAYLRQVQQMMQQYTGPALAISLTQTVATSDKSVDEVFDIYAQVMRKLMEVGLWGGPGESPVSGSASGGDRRDVT